MNEINLGKNNKGESVNNSGDAPLRSSKKVTHDIDPNRIKQYLSNKSKNDKISVLKNLISVKSQEINELSKKLEFTATNTTLPEVPTSIDGWDICLDPDGYYRLYKYLKVKNGNKACKIQIGRKFSVKKAKKRISSKLQQLRRKNVI